MYKKEKKKVVQPAKFVFFTLHLHKFRRRRRRGGGNGCVLPKKKEEKKVTALCLPAGKEEHVKLRIVKPSSAKLKSKQDWWI